MTDTEPLAPFPAAVARYMGQAIGRGLEVMADALGLPGTCSDCPEPARCEADGCHGMDGVSLTAAELGEIG